MTKIKHLIPNILTSSRILLTPIIIILCLTKNYKASIILIIIACITDLFDGKLARKWNIVSNTGAKLDAVADKVFAVGLITCLINEFNFFIVLIILEIIISLFNIYVYFKTNETRSLIIGKIKTTSLFITIVLGFISLFFGYFENIITGFMFITINLQILSLINYYSVYFDNKINKEVEENITKEKEVKRYKPYVSEKKIYDNDEEKEKKLSDTIVFKHLKNIFMEDDE